MGVSCSPAVGECCTALLAQIANSRGAASPTQPGFFAQMDDLILVVVWEKEAPLSLPAGVLLLLLLKAPPPPPPLAAAAAPPPPSPSLEALAAAAAPSKARGLVRDIAQKSLKAFAFLCLIQLFHF
jgi:hypothetical protein